MVYCFQCNVALLQILSVFFFPVVFCSGEELLTAGVLQEMNCSYNFEKAVV